MVGIFPSSNSYPKAEDREVLQQKSQPMALQEWGLRTPKYVLGNTRAKCRKALTQLERTILDRISNQERILQA